MVATTQAAVVDVIALLNEQRLSRYQILVAALCAAVVFMDGYDAQAIGYVAPTLNRVWQLQPGALDRGIAGDLDIGGFPALAPCLALGAEKRRGALLDQAA